MPRSLNVVDPFGRDIDDSYIQREVARSFLKPLVVESEVSGIHRTMTIFLAVRNADLIKWAYHGDQDTFCPPIWADIAIGAGACGFGCRSCFLMLTFRAMKDPLRPVIYTNGDDFEHEVRKWLHAKTWLVEFEGPDKKKKVKRRRQRTSRDAIGLGIDCSDSLLWEGITGHARRLAPLFIDARTNPLGNPLILLTKSANVHYLEEVARKAPRNTAGRIPNVVITMSLNPEPIADLWEGKFPDTLRRITPPISRRLEAMKAAQDMGFEVRARIDPIMIPDGWEAEYDAFFHEMAHKHGIRPTMLTLGSHREKMPQLDAFRAWWGLPAMEFEAEKTAGREGTHIHMVGRDQVYITVRDMIIAAFAGTGHVPHVSLCKETHEVRKTTGMCNSNCNCLPETPSSRRHLALVG